MNSAASKLVSFSNNAGSLRNLIQRHLLRPSTAAAAVTQVLKPQLPSQFNTDDSREYLKMFPIQNPPSYNAAKIMFGIDQSGILEIHTRRSDLTDADNDDAHDDDELYDSDESELFDDVDDEDEDDENDEDFDDSDEDVKKRR